MSAILFYWWNPYVADDGSFFFDVTAGDTFPIYRGSREFIDAALAAFGIEAGSYTWKVEAGRSHYYSSYPDEDDWRDRWPEIWRFHVRPEQPLPARINEPFRNETHTGLSDDSSGGLEDEEERYRHTAFLIVDFRIAREEIEQLVEEAWQHSGLRPLPKLEIRELDYLRQLYVVVNELSLPEDVPALEEFLTTMKTAGGAINWHSRPAKPPPPLLPEIIEWMTKIGRPPPKTS